MEISKGMKFRGKKNGRDVLILDATAISVRYRDLKYGTVFNVGRELFEHCDIELIERG